MTANVICACAAAAACLIGTASAETGWYATLNGGVDIPVGGDLHDGATSTLTDLSGLNSALDESGTLTVRKSSWDDIYKSSPLVNFEVGYDYSSALRAYARLGYTWDKSSQIQVGDLTIPALGVTSPIYAKFSDYDAWLLTVGGRYTFDTESRLKPYIGADIGAAFVKHIDGDFTIPGQNISLQDVRLYDGTTAFTGGAELGVSYEVTPTVDVTGSVGIRYTGKLDQNDRDLTGVGLQSINDAGSRTTVPVMIGVSAKF